LKVQPVKKGFEVRADDPCVPEADAGAAEIDERRPCGNAYTI
jgi:hypothetical protein